MGAQSPMIPFPWRISFGLPSLLPTFNEMEKARGSSWGTARGRQNRYNLAKQAAQMDVANIARSALTIRLPIYQLALPLPPRVVLTCWWGPGRHDPDNLAAGKKIILDALVDIGVLQNDTREFVAAFHDHFPFENIAGFAVVVQLSPEE